MIDLTTVSLKDLAGFISQELTSKGIDAILVGGACVTIYSNNRYQSYDLDFITYEEMKIVKKALNTLGFHERHKYFQHEKCPWFIEFVSPPVAVGNELIRQFNNVKTELGSVKLLYPVDVVKDRLASFYYWHDKQGLQQAINICREQDIDIKEVERWSKKENEIHNFKIFKKLLIKKA